MIIALNNKCNLTKEEFKNYHEKLKKLNIQNNKLILCPSYIYLSLYDLDNIKLGSQNVSKEENGAFTGEVSASQLRSLNVDYTIVGHSERRNKLKESNDEINKKIKLLIKNNIIPILCVGESIKEKENGMTKEIISNEIKTALDGLTPIEKDKILIAYEPIWAIGTGIIPTIEEIDYVLNIIKTYLPNNKLLYGGSANDENITYLKQSKLIDGYLLGGLSLKIDKLQIFINKLI